MQDIVVKKSLVSSKTSGLSVARITVVDEDGQSAIFVAAVSVDSCDKTKAIITALGSNRSPKEVSKTVIGKYRKKEVQQDHSLNISRISSSDIFKCHGDLCHVFVNHNYTNFSINTENPFINIVDNRVFNVCEPSQTSLSVWFVVRVDKANTDSVGYTVKHSWVQNDFFAVRFVNNEVSVGNLEYVELALLDKFALSDKCDSAFKLAEYNHSLTALDGHAIVKVIRNFIDARA